MLEYMIVNIQFISSFVSYSAQDKVNAPLLIERSACQRTCELAVLGLPSALVGIGKG